MIKRRPSPSVLDDCEPIGAVNGRKRWRLDGGWRTLEWDELHGEIEVYDARGRHIGVMDPVSGDIIKPAVKGRRIDV